MTYNISIQDVLLKVNKGSCPKDINLHCHTSYSDGSLHPHLLIQQAIATKIQHIAVTDHHSISAYSLMVDYLETIDNNQSKPTLWSGIEISCLVNKCLVHILGLDFDISHKALTKYTSGSSPVGMDLQAVNVINAIHDAGGLAILAHPARYRIDAITLINYSHKLGIDGVEVWYDYDSKPKWSYSEYICQQIYNRVKELGLYSTCGTDSHGFSLLGR